MNVVKYNAFKTRKDKIFISCAVCVFILYLAFSFTFFSGAGETVREDVVRLHILANSDSEEDQQVKLKVRDALLNKNTSLLTQGVNSENAKTYFENSRDELLKTANGVLEENGFNYKADIVLCEEIYPTREYGELTFPAGEYTSVKVILGEGNGHNWWCVMFPPLCVPAAKGEIKANEDNLSDYITENGEHIVSSGEKYKVKFKILEWYEVLSSKLKNDI